MIANETDSPDAIGAAPFNGGYQVDRLVGIGVQDLQRRCEVQNALPLRFAARSQQASADRCSRSAVNRQVAHLIVRTWLYRDSNVRSIGPKICIPEAHVRIEIALRHVE